MTGMRMGQTLRDAMTAVQGREFDRARVLLERCAAEAPDDPRVWFWLAIASPSGAAAIPCLRRVVAIDPQHARSRAALAKLLLVQAVTIVSADRVQARALLVEASSLVPEYDAVWIGLAAVSEAPADSVAALRHAIALSPHRKDLPARLHDALMHHAVMLAKTGQRAEARALFREAADINPGDARVWQALAHLAETPSDAVRAWRELVALAPSAAHQAALEKALAAEAQARTAAEHARPEPRRAGPAPAPAAVRSTVPAPAAAAEPAAATVLVVDDSPTIRKILTLTLQRAGYQVFAEPDGERAVTRLADIVPDLILLDISMPKLDGYEVCKRIRKDPRIAHVPVVMLSGKDSFFDKVKGRMVGASEYLTKPFEAPAVLAVISKHRRRSSAEVANG